MNHTPTPWKISSTMNFREGRKIYITTTEEINMTDACQLIETEKNKHCLEANAAFIVTAVNAHEELVEVMRKAAKCIQECANEPDKMICVAGWLTQALAKAGVRS